LTVFYGTLSAVIRVKQIKKAVEKKEDEGAKGRKKWRRKRRL
jgi:hypothetical protein